MELELGDVLVCADFNQRIEDFPQLRGLGRHYQMSVHTKGDGSAHPINIPTEFSGAEFIYVGDDSAYSDAAYLYPWKNAKGLGADSCYTVPVVLLTKKDRVIDRRKFRQRLLDNMDVNIHADRMTMLVVRRLRGQRIPSDDSREWILKNRPLCFFDGLAPKRALTEIMNTVNRGEISCPSCGWIHNTHSVINRHVIKGGRLIVKCQHCTSTLALVAKPHQGNEPFYFNFKLLPKPPKPRAPAITITDSRSAA